MKTTTLKTQEGSFKIIFKWKPYPKQLPKKQFLNCKLLLHREKFLNMVRSTTNFMKININMIQKTQKKINHIIKIKLLMR